ncbi:arginine kinase-like [Pogonomyrmex barbatus]|uniref:arginine kinase n=1 Tax=Pogonomyrmex barbatus TaxID=144034 RepID=A0A6I9WTQ1_9HYME|nr:arginine kinase-like [Pogonomyrmex barbatus]
MIEEYHTGFRIDQVHSDLDWSESEKPDNLYPRGKACSLDADSLRKVDQELSVQSLAMSEIHYVQEEALTSLKDEFKGTYYTLGALDKQIRQQLPNEHFPFNQDDRLLKAADAKFWPISGTEIFFNKEKTFLVWRNEPDHMRLISMERGGNLAAVYEEGSLKRSKKSKRNWNSCGTGDPASFTFCPTNLAWHDHPSLGARSPAEIERGLSTVRKDRDHARSSEIAISTGKRPHLYLKFYSPTLSFQDPSRFTSL